jgi:hypothetical protein
MEKKERRMEEEAQCGGKSKGKEHLGVGGVGICCFIQPMGCKSS